MPPWWMYVYTYKRTETHIVTIKPIYQFSQGSVSRERAADVTVRDSRLGFLFRKGGNMAEVRLLIEEKLDVILGCLNHFELIAREMD